MNGKTKRLFSLLLCLVLLCGLLPGTAQAEEQEPGGEPEQFEQIEVSYDLPEVTVPEPGASAAPQLHASTGLNERRRDLDNPSGASSLWDVPTNYDGAELTVAGVHFQTFTNTQSYDTEYFSGQNNSGVYRVQVVEGETMDVITVTSVISTVITAQSATKPCKIVINDCSQIWLVGFGKNGCKPLVDLESTFSNVILVDCEVSEGTGDGVYRINYDTWDGRLLLKDSTVDVPVTYNVRSLSSGNYQSANSVLEARSCTFKGTVTLNGNVTATLTNCTLADYFYDVSYGCIVTDAYSYIAPIILNDQTSLRLVNSTAFDITSNGRNILWLQDTEVRGNILAAGDMRHGTGKFNNTEEGLRLFHNQILYSRKDDETHDQLRILLSGENSIRTNAVHNATEPGGSPNYGNYVYSPDIMVAHEGCLVIEDDPDQPDIGVLNIAASDADYGHWGYAAIGGVPSLRPATHGLIMIRGGIINAWSNARPSAVIGGSFQTPFIPWKVLQEGYTPTYEGNGEHIVSVYINSSVGYLYYDEDDDRYNPEKGGYYLRKEYDGSYTPVDSKGDTIYIPEVYAYDANGDPVLDYDSEYASPGCTLDAGPLWISGGVVNVEADAGGAAIGGAQGGNGGRLLINGGTVNAKARMGAAAIGGGNRYDYNGGDSTTLAGYTDYGGGQSGNITIEGGCVVNCYSDNNFYDWYNGFEKYPSCKGYVLGPSANASVVIGDDEELPNEVRIQGLNASPVITLQQDVDGGSQSWTPEQVNASWGNYIYPNNAHVVDTEAHKSFFPSTFNDAVIILIGRDYIRDENGNIQQGYDAEYNVHYDLYNTITHVISGYAPHKRDEQGNISGGEEMPLEYHNYNIQGQLTLPAWQDPWYSDVRFEEFTLPKDTTLTLLPGAVLNVKAGFKLYGDQKQLVVKKGAVIQGEGAWPGKKMPKNATPEEAKTMMEYLVATTSTYSTGTAGVNSGSARAFVTHLGIVKVSKDTYRTIPGDSPDEIRSSMADGEELCTILGAGSYYFVKNNDGSWGLIPEGYNKNMTIYLTEDGSLSASPNALCQKNNSKKMEITVTADGQVTLKNAKISTPSYTVYNWNQSNDDTLTLSYDLESDEKHELACTITLSDDQVKKNEAVFTIPSFLGSEFKLQTISALKDKCAVRYGGVLKLVTPFCDIMGIDIKRLQLKYGSSVTLDGIDGGGHVALPEIGGFPVSGKASMYLNTFAPHRELSISVNLQTPIFEGAFEGSLKEARGTFVVDTLYAEIAVGEGGIPLVPPTVVGYLMGGGLGFEGLADTVNMNSVGVPPIRFKIAAKGSIVDVINGWVRLSLGPSGFDLEMTGMKIKSYEFIKKLGFSASWDFGKLTLKTKDRSQTYWGTKADMSMSISMGIKVGSSEDLALYGNGKVGIGAFAGVYVNKDHSGGFAIQQNFSGTLKGGAKVPKQVVLGMLPVEDISLGEAEVGVYGAATLRGDLTADDTASATKVLKNLASKTHLETELTIGSKFILGGGDFPAFYVKAVYVLGDSAVKFSGGLGDGGKLFSDGEIEPDVSVPSLIEAGAMKVASLDLSKGEGGEMRLMDDDDTADVVLMGNATAISAEVRQAAAGKIFLAYKLDKPENKTWAELESILVPGSFAVTKDSTSVTLIEPSYDTNLASGNSGTYITNQANFILDKENGILFFAPAAVETETTYTMTLSAGAVGAGLTFNSVEVIKTVPFASLANTASATANGAAFAVEDAFVDRKYKVQVLLGETEGGDDYLLAESEEYTGRTNFSGSLAYTLADYTDIPSGTYYPSIRLLEYVTATDDSGNAVAVWSPVDQISLDTTVSHTNSTIPAAPESLSLAPTGNGTMTISWNPVVNADSYQLTVYEKVTDYKVVTNPTTGETTTTTEAEGWHWQDTELYFRVNKAEEETAPATRLVMDLTALDTAKTYCIGVKALRQDETQVGSQDSDTAEVAGKEALTGEFQMTDAAPPSISYSENVDTGEGGSHTFTVGKDGGSFQVIAQKSLTVTVTADPAKTVTVAAETPAEGEYRYTVTVPALGENDIASALTLQIKAADGTGPAADYALEYVSVHYDDVAPSLLPDNLGVFPVMLTEAGKVASITGTSEPGATVMVWSADKTNEGENISASVVVPEDGRFTVSLCFNTVPEFVYAQVVDPMGNVSPTVKLGFTQETAANTVTVSFDPNGEGAVCATANLTVEKGLPIGALPVPTRTLGGSDDNETLFKYQFAGWYTAANGGEMVTGGSSFTVDTTLYAHWEQTVTVTFIPDANPTEETHCDSEDQEYTVSVRNAECEISCLVVTRGAAIGELPVPRRTDGQKMMFLGWYTDEGATITEESVFNADTTVKARWASYNTVTFNAGQGKCSVTELQVPADPGKITEYPIPTATGYTFIGWYAVTGTDPDSGTVILGENPVTSDTVYAQDTVLCAVWTRNTTALTVTQNGCVEGQILPDPTYTMPETPISEIISYSKKVGTDDQGHSIYDVSTTVKPTEPGTYLVTVLGDTFETVYKGTAEFTITPVTIPCVKTAYLTLTGKIGLSFRVVIPENLKNAAGAAAVFVYKGVDQTPIPLSGLTPDTGEEYILTFLVPAKEIANKVGLKLVGENGKTYTLTSPMGTPYIDGLFQYSVTDYCAAAKNAYPNEAYLIALVDALQNYGTYAWTHFQSTDRQPELATNVNMSGITADDLLNYKHTTEGAIEGVRLSTISLILESETVIFLRFKLTDGVTTDQLSVTGGSARTEGSDLIVEIPNIAAKDLDKEYTVTIEKDGATMTLKVFALTYVRSVLLRQSEMAEALLNTVKALYLYNQAANAYFPGS